MATYEFYVDAEQKAMRRNRLWYKENLIKVLHDAKKRQARDVDVSIELAEKLLKKLGEPIEKPVVVPLRELTQSEHCDLMKPIEPEIMNLLHGSTEKGACEKYLKARNKKAPEDKFHFRITSNWDYGWQQKLSKMCARDVTRGRCAVLRDTFYRKNNLAPDPPHYSQPSGAETSICSEYSCTFN